MDLSNENIIHQKKDGVEYLQFRRLLEYEDIIKHAYSLGIDKNYRTEKPNKEEIEEGEYQKAIKNYKNLCNAIGITQKKYLIKTNQEHTDEVKNIKEKIEKNIKLKEQDLYIEKYEKTDGLITNQKDIILATTNADCILMLFFDPKKKVVANIHSGWRGTLQRISVKTVEKMKKEYNCEAKDIICCICPSIRKCHFEVDQDVKEYFEKEFQDIKNINEIIEETVSDKNNKNNKNNKNDRKWHIDTVKINQIILEREGLKPDNIIDSKICSVCNSNIVHSYRVEKQGYGLNTLLGQLGTFPNCSFWSS